MTVATSLASALLFCTVICRPRFTSSGSSPADMGVLTEPSFKERSRVPLSVPPYGKIGRGGGCVKAGEGMCKQWSAWGILRGSKQASMVCDLFYFFLRAYLGQRSLSVCEEFPSPLSEPVRSLQLYWRNSQQHPGNPFAQRRLPPRPDCKNLISPNLATSSILDITRDAFLIFARSNKIGELEKERENNSRYSPH